MRKNDIKTLVAYSADPWESALPLLRYIEPARQLGIQVLYGNQGPQVDVDQVAQADLVLIQRDFPRFVEGYARVIQAARRQGKPVVYEIDDLLLTLPESHISWPDISLMLYPILWAIQEADLVTTSTAVLGDYLRPLNPNIWLLPNYLVDRLWTFQPTHSPEFESAPVVIGYMGGQTHSSDLLSLVPVLQDLLARYPARVALRFWGGPPPAALQEYAAVEWIPLNILDYETFARYFSSQQADIFIAPLDDTGFNRAKSGIKYLEYSALGVPGVYSRIAPYMELIDEGKNGFLAFGPEEWSRALCRLVENPALRLAIGAAAQATIRQDWLLSQHAGEWQAAYQQAISRAARPSPELDERQAIFSRLGQQVQKRQYQLLADNAQLGIEVEARTAEARHLQAQLDEILHSRSWRTMTKLHQLRYQLVPLKSRREKFLQSLGVLAR